MAANVTLLSHTPDPERVIAAAAKLCYSSASMDRLMEKIDQKDNGDFVQMLANMGHESPIEHVTFTFAIEGVSRSLLAQITRHRIASYSVKSQRYVSEKGFEFVTPPEIQAIPQAQELYQEVMAQAAASYQKLADLLQEKHTQTLIQQGMEEGAAKKAAQKMAIEDARFVLPNACETKMIVTMNARSLLNFFRHRCCNRAQWEIRDLAWKMLELVYQVAPNVFAKAGPSCAYGPCPEGKMSCGRAEQVREFCRQQKETWKNGHNSTGRN